MFRTVKGAPSAAPSLPLRAARVVPGAIAPSKTLDLAVAKEKFEKLVASTGAQAQVTIGLGDNGRGLLSTKDLTSDDPLNGEVLLSVPLSLTIPVLLDEPENYGHGAAIQAAQKAQLEDLGAPTSLCIMVRDVQRGPAVRLATWFAWLCAHSPMWKEYRDLQPHAGSYMSLLRVPEGLLAELQDEEAVQLVKRMQGQASAAYAEVEPDLKDMGVSREDFLWALECVSTRAFFRAQDGVKVGMLVPFADMANHVTFPNADFDLDFKEGRYRMVRRPVAGPMPSGSEVFISYGTKLDNVELLVKYGFIQPGNRNDFLPGLPEWGPARTAPRSHLLVDLVMSQLVEDNKDEVARARYTSVLLSIPPEPKGDEGTGSGVAPSEADPKDRNASGLTRQNQSARWMLGELEKMRSAFVTTPEEDEARLQSLGADPSGLLPIERFLVATRLERKKLVLAAIEVFQLWLKTYAGGY